MEHSEIILIALILAVVFAGSQVYKVISLFSVKEMKKDLAVQPKTIVKAEKNLEKSKKASAVKKSVSKAKKTTGSKPKAKKTVQKTTKK